MAGKRRLAAVMFTDTVGYTSSTHSDEAGALRRLREEEDLVRPLLTEYGGREVKSTGDGFLVEFESALKASQCGVEIQRTMHERNSRPGIAPIVLRIGIHLGDVEPHGDDIFGDAVNIASRVEQIAEPGGICLSVQVYDQIHNKVPYPIMRIGTRSLKGLGQPVEVYRISLPWIRTSVAPEAASIPRIAVLPFVNISPDPKDEYFADGLTEELITVLSQIKGLRVISRTSVNQYKGTTKAVAQIGSELGADSVLEGSVRKAGEQLRIAVQLIDTRSDEHRWAQTYDRKLENVFAIQAEVAERTAGALRVELLSPERGAIRERPTTNLEAYESYLRGIKASEEFGVHFDQAVDSRAVNFFEDAIRRDPEFSAAMARLAGHLIHVMGETRPEAEVLPKVRALVARAVELSPHSSDAHAARASLAMQVDHDWSLAEAEFQQAISLNPSNSAARQDYGHLLSVLQRYEEARKQFLAALEEDPLSFYPRWALVWLSAQLGDRAAALSAAKNLVEAYPDRPGARSLLAHEYVVFGRTDEALEAARPLATNTDQFSRETHASILALAERSDEARAFLDDWEGGRLPERYPLRYAASLWAAIGEDEHALTLLERDAREGDRALWHVYQLPHFDRLRSDPRFVAMLRALNLPVTLRRALFLRPPRPPG